MSDVQLALTIGGIVVITLGVIGTSIAVIDGWRVALWVLLFTLVLSGVLVLAALGWAAFVLSVTS